MKNSDNHQILNNGDTIAINKLYIAFENHDLPSLTLTDLFQLVYLRLIHPDTAARISKEAGYVS